MSTAFRVESLALILVAVGCGRASAAGQDAAPPPLGLEVSLGVKDDGTATAVWAEGIAVAVGREAADTFAREVHPLTPEARAWFEVTREAVPAIQARVAELATLFAEPPPDMVIVVGNRGSSDAFAWMPDHVGINAQAFVESYGPPDEGAVDRMVRIVAHEILHLMTYAAYPDHLEVRTTPWERALWTMFFEGIGDFVSVSERWKPVDGVVPEVTRTTLARLEPIFVGRLEAFAAHPSEDEERELRKGLTIGKFDRKWGSLPVALWMRMETIERDELEVLAEMLRLGPDGVLPLALRHIAPELRPRIEALAAVRR